MSQNLNIQEMAIAISVEKNDPTILTPDFLKQTGIVNSDWELARELLELLLFLKLPSKTV